MTLTLKIKIKFFFLNFPFLTDDFITTKILQKSILLMGVLYILVKMVLKIAYNEIFSTKLAKMMTSSNFEN